MTMTGPPESFVPLANEDFVSCQGDLKDRPTNYMSAKNSYDDSYQETRPLRFSERMYICHVRLLVGCFSSLVCQIKLILFRPGTLNHQAAKKFINLVFLNGNRVVPKIKGKTRVCFRNPYCLK